MAKKQSSLQDFAREAEQQYRRLADMADSAGVAMAASALRDKANRMQALWEAGKAAPAEFADLSEAAPEVHLVIGDLFTRLQVALLGWPPETPSDLVELVNDVLGAADRLSKMGRPPSSTGVRPRAPRARRRWAAAETPPAIDPPSFPGPKRQRKKS